MFLMSQSLPKPALKYPPQLDTGKRALRMRGLTRTVGQKCGDLCSVSIMLVDDNPFNLIPLEGMIEHSLGLKTVKFLNGFDAISCFQRRLLSKCCGRHFKLILTDIQMPQIDGFRLANTIKSIENVWLKVLLQPEDSRQSKAKRVTIIAITASDKESVEESARKAGMK